ncbi:hypothetical protein BDU57DRAFT_510793 [Ampelomyces quisqualis]|uniref:Uncharacterized protein n=1 Tax=Ampelomyces quisqualis TaxID=50730 RepID=A0A6A5R164_AMPQU|nr:hypothetical protein BDU57DRAFT_510793 [Ampelomyces quisqualis]
MSHFLYGLPLRFNSQNVGHHKAFLQAVRRVKLPSVVNSISATIPPAILGFLTKDVQAMLAFHKLRGLPALPLDLEVEWKYTLESHPVYEHPQFISITLESWKDMFVRVNITATVCDRRLKRQILQSTDTPSLDDQQSLALVEYRLYGEATRLAQLLVRKNGGMTFGFSTKRAGIHWTGSSTRTRTIEVVDGETRQVTPVALLRYDRSA